MKMSLTKAEFLWEPGYQYVWFFLKVRERTSQVLFEANGKELSEKKWSISTSSQSMACHCQKFTVGHPSKNATAR